MEKHNLRTDEHRLLGRIQNVITLILTTENTNVFQVATILSAKYEKFNIYLEKSIGSFSSIKYG